MESLIRGRVEALPVPRRPNDIGSGAVRLASGIILALDQR